MDGRRRRSLVENARSHDDGRAREISVTLEGTALLDQSPGSARVAGIWLAGALSTEEVEELVRLLRICAHTFEAAGDSRLQTGDSRLTITNVVEKGAAPGGAR